MWMLEILGMKELLSKASAKDAYVRYFNTLRKRGYLGGHSSCRLLVYTFIMDLLHSDLNWYITDEDYAQIRKALRALYGDCLLPYPIFCTNRIVLGSPMLLGDANMRITEVEEDMRVTEDGYTRVVEVKTERS